MKKKTQMIMKSMKMKKPYLKLMRMKRNPMIRTHLKKIKKNQNLKAKKRRKRGMMTIRKLINKLKIKIFQKKWI